ncbi:MAG: hypothetical protein J6R80_04195 [Kiritimatiellae bacterium]|nr:hypothetical protein [Kiritimatiellia bacterium]
MFIFLNHLGMEKGVDIECTKMLRKAIASADSDPTVSRVFVFSHPEIWNVNYFRFNENAGYLSELMAARKLDAYFSGHVHMNSVTARKNDYGMALRQICAAGVWPPVKEGPKRFHAVPSMQLNPLPSKRLFSDFPADVESYILVEASKEKVVLTFEEVGGGVIGQYEWKGPYDLNAVKRAQPRFKESLPQKVARARLWYYPLFVDRIFNAPKAPRFRVNGRDVGEVKRNYSFYHSNWGKFYIDLPVDLIGKENKVEIVNPSGERFLIRDLALMAAGTDGVEHFTPVHEKMISFGDYRTFYMGFGLVHENMGILHSDIETNASSEVIEVVPYGQSPYLVELNFR